MNESIGSLSEMVNSSIEVITKPSVATFERYEKRGTLQKALVYAAIGALLAAVVGFPNGIVGVLENAITALLASSIFVGVVYYFGKNQGGTGTLDEVAYTFALFLVPLGVLWPVVLLVLLLIPILGWCLIPFAIVGLLAAHVFYGYLAVQSSMNMYEPRKSMATLGVAALATLLGYIVIGNVF